MVDDISAALLYQVKKEIAERYFGGRKAIEEEKEILEKRIQAFQNTLGKAVYEDFCQIYQLLKTGERIEEFCQIIGLKGKPFYSRYLKQKGQVKNITDQKIRGLTESRRYKNLLLEYYKQLTRDLKQYQKGYYELMEECLIINEEIAQLTANYNLGDILSFIRSIEDIDSLAGTLGENIIPTQREDLEKKLIIPKLDCLGDKVVEFPSLPTLNRIKDKLKDLAGRAYRAQGSSH